MRPTWPVAGAIQPAVVYRFADPIFPMGSHAATIRFSIGPKDAGRLIADLAQALDRLPQAGTAGLHAGAGGAS